MRLPDYLGKKNVAFISGFLVSIFTALTGICNSFWQLVLCRIGTAASGAVAVPATMPLLSEYFPPYRRGFAMAIYSIGIYVSTGLNTGLLGSFIDVETTNYKQVFLMISIPQAVLSFCILLTLRDKNKNEKKVVNVLKVLKYMKTKRSFWCLLIAGSMSMIAVSTWGSWYIV